MSRESLPPEMAEVRLHGSDSRAEGALRAFGGLLGFAAPLLTLAVAGALLLVATLGAEPGTLASTRWNPAQGAYGVLPFLMGTIVVAVLAMAVALPIGVLAAVYLAELAPPKLARAGAVTLELMAATPAVVIGSWGRAGVVPALRDTATLIGVAPDGHGFGIVAASLVLAVMTVPTIATVARAILRALPDELREGPMALGVTRWETISSVLLPCARRGLVAAGALGFGRALGETIAVSMVIGGRPVMWPSFGGPAATASSVLVDELLDATHPAHLAALAVLALVLLVFGAGTSAAARFASEKGVRP
jgi:phosphate transport system permease protein